MIFQLLQQFLRIVMFRKTFQSLLDDDVGRLKVSGLLWERRQVVVRLEQVGREGRGGREEGPSLFYLSTSHLQDPQVVEGLCVVVVGREGQAEALVCQARVANGQTDVTDVVPDIPLMIKLLYKKGLVWIDGYIFFVLDTIVLSDLSNCRPF